MAMAALSKALPVKSFLESITKGSFHPVYYFSGTENYRIREAEKYLVHQYLPDKQIITNYNRLDGKKVKTADILTELAVFPMLGERQIIAISSFQSYRPTEVDKILAAVNPPNPNQIIILSSPSEKAPKKSSAFYKKMLQHTMVIEFNRLLPQEAASLVHRKLQAESISIEKEALQFIVDMIAGNRGALEVECDKLLSFKKKNETVTVDDIENVCSGYEVYSIFDLAEKIISSKPVAVYRQLRSLIADGNSADNLLYFIEQHFLLLYLAKNNKPVPASRRWLLPRFKSQASKLKNETLESFLQESSSATSQIRRGGMKPDMVLESLVANLINQTD